jgi:hypothetical protein
MDFADLLNHIMTYPVIFQTLGGAGEMPTKTAAVQIINTFRDFSDGADTDNAAKISIFIEGSHLPLA